MDIMELGAIGELVGGVAVLVTLIYLATQVRQARHEVAMAGIRARAISANEVLAPIVGSDHLPRIMSEIRFTDYGDFGLSEEDTVRFGAWCHTWMQASQGRFYTLQGGAQESEDELRLFWLSTTWGSEFWEKNKGIYDASYVAHMADLKRRLTTDARSSEQIMAGEGR